MSAKKDDPALDSGSAAEGVKMVLTVTLVAAIAAGLLGFVYAQTKDRIAESQKQEKIQAFGYILPDFDNAPLETERAVALDGVTPPRPSKLYTATKGGALVGYALHTNTPDGFGPNIELIVGATPDGTVTGVYILTHQETPGLGAKMTDGQTLWEHPDQVDGRPFILQFLGKNPASFRFAVTKDGGQVDAITASTITSRAVADVVAAAVKTIQVAAAAPASAPAPSADDRSEGGAR